MIKPIGRVAIIPTLLVLAGTAAVARVVQSTGNPILADGSYYTTDPAPVVDGDTLYILAGRDEAPDGVNDFIMNEWQLLSTQDPASRRWRHDPGIARPERLFAWASPGRAYAGQIVKARNGRFYFYAPVEERNSDARDRFAIGVAVSDSPHGPWKDAHPAGPIISQRVPESNDIQNIDPTVLVDEDGRVFIYWGTFGRLRGMELASDMVSAKGPEQVIEGLTGFFEAPWIMKRKGVYYMLYAGNNAGPDSPCTPALYHACQAYGTATSPLGPWTYRGVVLKPVSSTTSHAGAVEFKGKWYITYHTADAKGGGHFRRSVAIDRLEWDDSVTPAAIRPVVPTIAPRAAPRPGRNIAPAATPTAGPNALPTQFWLKSLNDGIIRAAPLPPDMWSSWRGKDNPATPWIEYRWPAPVTLNGSRIRFFADQPAGAGEGVAPPASWRLEYWDGGWRPVRGAGSYGTSADTWQTVDFPPVTTRCLRAQFVASKGAGVGVQEWEALGPQATVPPLAPKTAAPPCDRP
ncbi:family 43 glycosylhydrolase [Sphingomonas carotinifaciens]|nr:family 43 glycosylhydrolase [Sphingomonas carotinifaciens]MBB4084725.1 hypothetical protein [Sphingomonas carotinifaciens]SDF16639.1 Glycosyl hydrolases family 43 [Sphingomonas carotinifaciens]